MCRHPGLGFETVTPRAERLENFPEFADPTVDDTNPE